MDNEKQKQEVIDFLESTYTGAKMMGDDEVMLRASRALLAFKADVHKDIFIEENMLDAMNSISIISMVYEVKPIFFRGRVREALWRKLRDQYLNVEAEIEIER